MSNHEGSSERPAGWVHHPRLPVLAPLDMTMDLPVAAGDWPLRLHLIYTADGLYVPAISRRPRGRGPFPTIIVLHGGSGGLGVPYLLDQVQHQGWAIEALLARDYAVVFAEGRMEHEDAYGTDMPFELDHKDVVQVLGFVGREPWANRERIAFFGVSHGGELQLKLVHQIADRLDIPMPVALVMCEPAIIEFLGLKYDGVRKEANLQFRGPIPDSRIDIGRARERIGKLPSDLPILVLGRDEDHLQGLFMKLHELLVAAGKRAEWATFSHPEHAYQLGPRRSPSGGYRPDPVQRATLEHVLGFLDAHVRERR